MLRRELLRKTVIAGSATLLSDALLFAEDRLTAADSNSDATGLATKSFKLGYAPHPGMFKKSAGDDVIDQIKFAADEGFTAWEDNGVASRSVEEQEKIGKTLDQLGMQMGVFVAYASFDEPSFTKPKQETTDEILRKMRNSVEVAARVNAKWFTVVPGSIDQQSQSGTWNKYGGPRLSDGYQTANVIDMLRRCAEVIEPHGLVMVLEPLNWHANHGGTFLRYSDQAFSICRAVNSPSCKILFDIYHQQITEGNLIPNIDACWEEIAYFQSGDTPGRKEPYTGEINYQNVFHHLHKKGFTGVIGMEHGNSVKGIDGERKVIESYRRADDY